LKKVTNLGIGSWALNQLVQLSKQTGKKILWLKSMDTGNAVKFYQKLGFIETGVVRLDFDGFKDELRNMVIMRLKVD
jgi:GNAT superfamily N-acetyltransferase